MPDAKAFAASGRFQPGANLNAWLHRIMINTFITGYRRRRAEPPLVAGDAFGWQLPGGRSRANSAEDQVAGRQLDADLAAAVSPSRGRGDRLLGCSRESVQPYPQKRRAARMAAVPVSQGGPAGRRGLHDNSAGRLAHLGRDQRRLAFAAGEHPEPEQVRLASCLMMLYFLGGCHGNRAPFSSSALLSDAISNVLTRDYGAD